MRIRFRSNIKYISAFILLTFLFIIVPSNLLHAFDKSNAIYENLGYGIIEFSQKICTLINSLSRGHFQTSLKQSNFSNNLRVLNLSFHGYFELPGKLLKSKFFNSLSKDCPLPVRPECQGFIRISLPNNISDNMLHRVEFRLDLAAELDKVAKTIAIIGIGKVAKNVQLIPKQEIAKLISLLPEHFITPILEKYFNGFIDYLKNRTISKSLDEIIIDGRLTGSKALQAIGIDELVNFNINFVLGILKGAFTNYVKNSSLINTCAGIFTAAGISHIGINALLQVISIKISGFLFDFGMQQFELGIYRDRFAKIEAYFIGTWSPGKHHIPWLIDTISKEAKKDRYDTLNKLTSFLNNRDKSKRYLWKPIYNDIKNILMFKIQQDKSWLADRYLRVWELLFKLY